MLEISGIDSHFHIFSTDLKMCSLNAERRYTPTYDALIEEHLKQMKDNNLSHGVIVQPSFLGTDNSFMLRAIKKYPEQLRGVAVIDKNYSNESLMQLNNSGIVGIRLNLVGKELENYSSETWKKLFSNFKKLNWFIEIQRDIKDLPKLIQTIQESELPIIIDHFGLCNGEIDKNNQKEFLSLLKNSNIWIKVSASYRAKLSIKQAKNSLNTLIESYGHYNKLIWGSDWPHTQFEKLINFEQQINFMNQLLSDKYYRQKILIDNPSKLFFNTFNWYKLINS